MIFGIYLSTAIKISGEINSKDHVELMEKVGKKKKGKLTKRKIRLGIRSCRKTQKDYRMKKER